MMHENRAIAPRSVQKHIAQPVKLCLPQNTTRPALVKRIKRDQAQRKIIDNIIDECRRPFDRCCIGESRAKRPTPVMVPRHHEIRDRQFGQDFRHQRILVPASKIPDIAGKQHHIRARHHCRHMGNRLFKRTCGIHLAIGKPAARPDMQVGQLCNQHFL